jgi:hypothetical protein
VLLRPPPRPELPKTLTGIRGFDEITRGGLPRGRPTLVCGGPGSGKTLLAVSYEDLEGRYDLEVIDVCQQPVLTQGEQIIAAPTLIKMLPLPVRRLVGDMSHRERVPST